MPLNIPGLLAPFQLLVRPRIVVPNVIVKDIRYIDFAALRKAGYRGAVFDKDNCLTIPYKDTLVPELESAWSECRKTFGENNVLIVSNSAGTYTDAGGIQSESVTHHLKVPVLQHSSFKPSYSCISNIRIYFSSLSRPIQDDELVIVGDRIFTDVVLANRMRLTNPKLKQVQARKTNVSKVNDTTNIEKHTTSTSTSTIPEIKEKEKRLVQGRGPLSIWTIGVWEKENMGIRWIEKKVVQGVEKWSKEGKIRDGAKFVKRISKDEDEEKLGLFGSLVSRFKFSRT